MGVMYAVADEYRIDCSRQVDNPQVSIKKNQIGSSSSGEITFKGLFNGNWNKHARTSLDVILNAEIKK